MFKNEKKNQKGFTLLELLAVLIIMAALSAIAIPIFTNKGDESRATSHKTNLRELLNTVQRYNLTEGTPAVTDTTFYGIINESNKLVTGGMLNEAPASPFAEVVDKKAFKYAIGLKPGTTKQQVMLVATSAATDETTVKSEDVVNTTTGEFILGAAADGAPNLKYIAADGNIYGAAPETVTAADKTPGAVGLIVEVKVSTRYDVVANKIHAIAVAQGSAAPTVQEVVDGIDYDGVTAVTNTTSPEVVSADGAAAVEVAFDLAAVAGAGNYDVYVVVEDANGNFSEVKKTTAEVTEA